MPANRIRRITAVSLGPYLFDALERICLLTGENRSRALERLALRGLAYEPKEHLPPPERPAGGRKKRRA